MNKIFALIKKGILCRLKNVRVPNNKSNFNVVKYLYKNNYLFTYKLLHKHIIINIKYFENKSVIQQININNKKKKNNNVIKYKNIRKDYMIFKEDILVSSAYGIVNVKQSLLYKVGGNLLVKLLI